MNSTNIGGTVYMNIAGTFTDSVQINKFYRIFSSFLLVHPSFCPESGLQNQLFFPCLLSRVAMPKQNC
uniref:Uncharacterized protein n=1 Tax=Arundo donax TaxID=35708 RepID=A0A0A9SE13_ARUDO